MAFQQPTSRANLGRIIVHPKRYNLSPFQFLADIIIGHIADFTNGEDKPGQYWAFSFRPAASIEPGNWHVPSMSRPRI